MAMAIPDRSTADRTLVSDAALNGSPASPFRYTINNGYRVVDATTTDKMVFLKVPRIIDMTNEADARIILGWHNDGVDDPTIICMGGMHHYANGLSSNPTNSLPWVAEEGKLYPGYTYLLAISTDANNIEFWSKLIGTSGTDADSRNGGLGGAAPLNVSGMHTNSEVYNWGYAPAAIRDANPPGGTGAALSVLEGIEIVAVIDDVASPTADLASFQRGGPVGFASLDNYGGFLGKVAAAYTALPLLYSTQTAGFEIRGKDELWATTARNDNTAYTVTIDYSDPYSRGESGDITVLVGEGAGISALVCDNLAVTAPATAVGTLSVTDTNTNNVITYELVAGSGDTNNDLFAITVDALDFQAASSAGTYYCRVKATDLWGKTTEAALTVVVS